MKRYRYEDGHPQDSYASAEKQVKRLKGFYSHLAVYIVVNIAIYAANIHNAPKDANLFAFKYLSTAAFWGIGLFAHGMSVFGQQLFLGPKWEERKIREIMEKERGDKWE